MSEPLKKILVCVDYHRKSAVILRAAQKHAKSNDADLVVLYVETPKHFQMSGQQRTQVLSTLNAAEEIGAEVFHIQGKNELTSIVEFVKDLQHKGTVIDSLFIGKKSKVGFIPELKISLSEKIIQELIPLKIETVVVPLIGEVSTLSGSVRKIV